jgi:hypothetical protein
MSENKNVEISEFKKISISLWSALLFLLISHKQTYKLTGKLFSKLKLKLLKGDEITLIGYVLHAIVFALIVRISMIF